MSKALVNKATVDNRDPCQGFHLRELAEATKRSIDDTQTIEDQLVKQLKRNKPNVKRKALKVIKYICDNGSSNFKRGFQRHTHILRECAQYRGPPDPVYGDAPYEEVRTAAKAAIDALFQTTNTEQEQELRNRIQGMGSSGMSGMGSSGMGSSGGMGSSDSNSYSVGKYTGHGGGTSSSSSNKNDQGITGKVWGWMGGKKDEPKDDFQHSRNTYGGPSSHSSGAYGGPSSHSSGGYQVNSNPTQLNSDIGDRHGKRSRGAVGGVWGNPQSTASLPSSTNFGTKPQTFGKPQVFGSSTTTADNTSSIGGKIKSAATTGEYEQQVIDAATHSTGVKVAPTQKELSKFVQQYQGLDQDTVAELLAEKMESEVWQVQLKSLYLTEAVLKSGYGDDLIDFLQKNEDLIEDLMKANKRNVRTKAKDVAKMLGMKTGSSSRSAKKKVVAAPQPPQQQQQDLLNFGASEPAPAPAQQDDIFSAAPAAPPSGGDMFSGMNTGEPEKTADMFGSMSLGDNSADMFGSTQKSDPATAPSDDLFSGLNTTQPASTSDSLFTTPASKVAVADNLLASAFSNSNSTNSTSDANSSNFFMTPSQPVQNNSTFNLNQPSNTGMMGTQSSGFNLNQPAPTPFMSTTQPSSQPMQGFATQPQTGFGFVNQQQPNPGFGMQANTGFGMQQNTGFGMQQNTGFGMQQNTGFGMQTQSPGFGMPQPGFNRGMQQPAASGRPGVDHFANLIQSKKVPAKQQQKHKRGGSDAFADLVKF